MRSIMKYLSEALVIGIIVFAVYSYQSRNLLATDLQAAPALRAALLDGAGYELGSEPARKTLIYFFAPWCRICSASSGNINLLRRLRSTSELQILLVALDWQSRDEVREYVDRNEISVPVLLGDRSIANAWNIYAYPTYYTLDSQNRVMRRDLGYSTFAGLWWRTL